MLNMHKLTLAHSFIGKLTPRQKYHDRKDITKKAVQYLESKEQKENQRKTKQYTLKGMSLVL